MNHTDVKIVFTENIFIKIVVGIVPSYKIGWNACIDEILKGTEEVKQ